MGGHRGRGQRVTAMGRTLPLDFSPANGRSTSREGLDFDESTAVDPIQKPAARAIPPQAVIRPQCQRSNLGCNPLGGARPSHRQARASSGLTARPARRWQARRLPRCRDSARCFPASCAREAAALLSDCPFFYILCGLGPSHRMRAIGRAIKPSARDPRMDDPGILPGRQVRLRSDPARK